MGGKILLEAKDLTIKFGGLVAVDSVNLQLAKGKIWALIGPNGAGKSTVLNLFTGIYTPSSGEIFFDGSTNAGLKAFDIVKKGIGRTFQSTILFKELTVLQNVMVGYSYHINTTVMDSIIHNKRFKEEEAKARKIAEETLLFLGLFNKRDIIAGQLPYGQQRLLEIARALATQPKLLLLDEPTAGMIPIETEDLFQKLKAINAKGITILIIEHNINFIMNIADQIVVLDFGKKIAEGTPEEIKNHPKVIKSYLGGGDEDVAVI